MTQQERLKSNVPLPIASPEAALRRLQEDDPLISMVELTVSDEGTRFRITRWGTRIIAHVDKETGRVDIVGP